MDQQGGGVEIPHDKVIQALNERYSRALGELHQENAQLSAGIQVAVAQRDEAVKRYAELVNSRAQETAMDAEYGPGR
jgi:hypothetical protein